MEFKVFSGSANEPLSEAVATELGVRMAERELQRFPDGEMHVELKESVPGTDVYLLQPTRPPVEKYLFELFLLADAAWPSRCLQANGCYPILWLRRPPAS